MPVKRSAKVHKFHETSGDDQLPVFSILIDKEGEGMFGRIDVELLVQKAPKACEFFLQSCSGASNGEKKGAKRVSYRHNHFLRLTNEGLQVGDRSGVRTSSALDVENEIGRVSHGMGVISLCRSSSLFDESFFFCLTNDKAELESLDKRHAAFGRVVGGMDTLFALHDDLLPYVKEGCVIEGSPYTISGILPKTNTDNMAHHALVSESVVSGLSLELISYAIRRQNNEMEENSSVTTRNEMELNALKDLEGLGLLIGLRLSERLLYREATFGVSTPLDVARFVGQQLWKSAFGKKIDRMKHMDNIYFSLIDNNFRWLQGFSRLKTGYVVSTLVVCPPGYSEGSVASDEVSPSRRERIEKSPSHKDILVYTVGILRGVTQVLYPHGSVRIHATLNQENETQFILDFRPQTSS